MKIRASVDMGTIEYLNEPIDGSFIDPEKQEAGSIWSSIGFFLLLAGWIFTCAAFGAAYGQAQ